MLDHVTVGKKMALKIEAGRQRCLDKLGLAYNASDEEIKKTYKELALKHHPDKNNGDAEATRKFQEFSKAYYDLTNRYSKSRPQYCQCCGCCSYYDDDDDDDDEEDDFDDDDFDYFSDSYYSDEEDGPQWFYGKVFVDVFSEFIFKKRFQSRKKPDSKRFTPEEQEEDVFFDFLFKKYKSDREECVLTEEDLRKFHSYDEWHKSRDPKKRHNHQMRKARKKANSKMPGEKPKPVSKKQQLAEQIRREKEIKEIGIQLQAKFQQNKTQERKPLKGGIDRSVTVGVLQEMELLQDENRKQSIEENNKLKKIQAQQRLKEKRKRRKERKEMKKQTQQDAKKKLEEAEKSCVEPEEKQNVSRYQKKQEDLFGSKDVVRQDNEILFPMGNVTGHRETKEKEVKLSLLHQYFSDGCSRDSSDKQNQNTDTTQDTRISYRENSNILNDKGAVNTIEKSTLLQRHLSEYRELMKVQPVRHTEQQLREERTKQKQRQLQRQQEELEKLRTRDKNTFDENTAKSLKKLMLDLDPVEEEFERMRKEHLRKQQELERKRNEEERELLIKKSAQKRKFQTSSKWYEKAESDSNRTQTTHPVQVENVWQTRHNHQVEIDNMRPGTLQEEEEMIQKVLKESQESAAKDEERRKMKMEFIEKKLKADQLKLQQEKNQVFDSRSKDLWGTGDPPLSTSSGNGCPVSHSLSSKSWSTVVANNRQSKNPLSVKNIEPKSIVTSKENRKLPVLTTNLGNLKPNLKLNVAGHRRESQQSDDWDEEINHVYLPAKTPKSCDEYLKWQQKAKEAIDIQSKRTSQNKSNLCQSPVISKTAVLSTTQHANEASNVDRAKKEDTESTKSYDIKRSHNYLHNTDVTMKQKAAYSNKSSSIENDNPLGRNSDNASKMKCEKLKVGLLKESTTKPPCTDLKSSNEIKVNGLEESWEDDLVSVGSNRVNSMSAEVQEDQLSSCSSADTFELNCDMSKGGRDCPSENGSVCIKSDMPVEESSHLLEGMQNMHATDNSVPSILPVNCMVNGSSGTMDSCHRIHSKFQNEIMQDSLPQINHLHQGNEKQENNHQNLHQGNEKQENNHQNLETAENYGRDNEATGLEHRECTPQNNKSNAKLAQELRMGFNSRQFGEGFKGKNQVLHKNDPVVAQTLGSSAVQEMGSSLGSGESDQKSQFCGSSAQMEFNHNGTQNVSSHKTLPHEQYNADKVESWDDELIPISQQQTAAWSRIQSDPAVNTPQNSESLLYTQQAPTESQTKPVSTRNHRLPALRNLFSQSENETGAKTLPCRIPRIPKQLSDLRKAQKEKNINKNSDSSVSQSVMPDISVSKAASYPLQEKTDTAVGNEGQGVGISGSTMPGLPQGLPPYLVQAYVEYLAQSSVNSQTSSQQIPDNVSVPNLSTLPVVTPVGMTSPIAPLGLPNPLMSITNPILEYTLQQSKLIQQQRQQQQLLQQQILLRQQFIYQQLQQQEKFLSECASRPCTSNTTLQAQEVINENNVEGRASTPKPPPNLCNTEIEKHSPSSSPIPGVQTANAASSPVPPNLSSRGLENSSPARSPSPVIRVNQATHAPTYNKVYPLKHSQGPVPGKKVLHTTQPGCTKLDLCETSRTSPSPPSSTEDFDSLDQWEKTLPPKLQKKREQTRAVKELVNKIHKDSHYREQAEKHLDKEQRFY